MKFREVLSVNHCQLVVGNFIFKARLTSKNKKVPPLCNPSLRKYFYQPLYQLHTSNWQFQVPTCTSNASAINRLRHKQQVFTNSYFYQLFNKGMITAERFSSNRERNECKSGAVLITCRQFARLIRTCFASIRLITQGSSYSLSACFARPTIR